MIKVNNFSYFFLNIFHLILLHFFTISGKVNLCKKYLKFMKRNEVNDMNNENTPDLDEEVMITLELDDGSVLDCSVIAIFEADEKEYIALLPVEEDTDADEGEVFLYRYSEDADGNPNLENIENDEEFEIVSEAFDELLDEAEFEELD